MSPKELERVKQLLTSKDKEMRELGTQLFLSLNGTYDEHRIIFDSQWSEEVFNEVIENTKNKYKTNTA